MHGKLTLIDERSIDVFIFLFVEISGGGVTKAVAGGVAAGAALLCASPAIAYAWLRRRKPQELFFDVPGE